MQSWTDAPTPARLGFSRRKMTAPRAARSAAARVRDAPFDLYTSGLRKSCLFRLHSTIV